MKKTKQIKLQITRPFPNCTDLLNPAMQHSIATQIAHANSLCITAAEKAEGKL